MPERRIGHFLIGRHLGQGLVSNCFQATNEETGAACALKILRPQMASTAGIADSFLSSPDITRDVAHPGVAKFLSSGRAGNTCYLEREFITAPTLRQYRVRHGALDPEFCVHIGALLSAMTNFAHSRNGSRAHGGISPHNVFIKLSPSGAATPALADFGSASSAITASGGFSNLQFPGEPGFFAPEIAGGAAPSPASDVFSIGAILYEMLSGAPPFQGTDNADTLRRLTETNPELLRNANQSISPYLENIVFKCLEKNPERRFSTPGELAAELRKPEATGIATLFAPSSESPSTAPAKISPADPEPVSALPFLHLENNLVRLEKGNWKKFVIFNPGDAPLAGSVSQCQGININPRHFRIAPDSREEILVRPSFAPPLESEFFINITSNGGNERVKIISDPESANAANKMYTAAAASVATSAVGLRMLWGLSSAPDASPAWMIVGAVFALCVAGAALSANQGLALAGSFALLFGAWTLLNFDVARALFAASAAACLIPAVVCRFTTTPLAKKTRPALAVIVAPLVLAFVALAVAETATGGAPLSFLSGPPFSGIERRSTENTAMSAFRSDSFSFSRIKKSEPEVSSKKASPKGKAVVVVITGETANVRSGPGTNHEKMAVVKKGRYFELIEESGSWMKIRIPGGGEGWVSSTLAAKTK